MKYMINDKEIQNEINRLKTKFSLSLKELSQRSEKGILTVKQTLKEMKRADNLAIEEELIKMESKIKQSNKEADSASLNFFYKIKRFFLFRS